MKLGPLCFFSTVEIPDLVLQETGFFQGPTHTRPAECFY